VTVAAVRLAGFRPLGEAPAGLAAPAGLGGPVAALAAIARPDRFAATLEAAGLEVASRAFFRDHRRFSGGDLEGIERRARSAAAIVTTEKDEPRLLEALGRHGSGRLGVLVWVAVTELDFLAGEMELRDAVARACGSPLDASASSVAGASSEGGRT
jgi:hypothetical protein